MSSPALKQVFFIVLHKKEEHNTKLHSYFKSFSYKFFYFSTLCAICTASPARSRGWQ